MKNVACRIFKEQIDLINELPKEDRANVLYSAIMSAYNQFENQNEIQTENQNEYAYISLSISKSIFNLLSKNIVFKEYNNYGGKRENSGRKPNITPNIGANITPNSLNNNNRNNLTETETETETENKKQKLKTETEKEKEYVFEGKVIKLNQKDYNEWKERFNLLDFDYELEQKDIWFSGQQDTKNWFIRTQKHFLNLQREKEKAKEAEARLMTSWWRE